ncbi:alpha/beta fold hydrolase [Ornithinibacillus scapharcae]|uniref:alpha/beta fold hydrolase n=1 Tax=Ornithinibacillus scapharcae TaxID=1147159 RepID=UPI000225AD58|nr:alpha/beta hydrolase [Ornithinibacillus scapharcae]
MYLMEYGKKDMPILVFLHGGGVSGWMWDEQINYFSENYHCIVPDLPGHGLSKEEHFTIQDSARAILDLLKDRKSEQPIIVVGFSLGAQILVQMLSDETDFIDFAIINSALTKPMKYSSKLIYPLLKISFPLVKLKQFAKLQAKVLYIREEQFESYYQETISMTYDSFIQVMRENMAFQTPENFKDSSTKILITVGEKEKKIMRDSAKELVHQNNNSKGIIIPSIGHGVSLANPKFFHQIVEDWIATESLPKNVQVLHKQK